MPMDAHEHCRAAALELWQGDGTSTHRCRPVGRRGRRADKGPSGHLVACPPHGELPTRHLSHATHTPLHVRATALTAPSRARAHHRPHELRRRPEHLSRHLPRLRDRLFIVRRPRDVQLRPRDAASRPEPSARVLHALSKRVAKRRLRRLGRREREGVFTRPRRRRRRRRARRRVRARWSRARRRGDAVVVAALVARDDARGRDATRDERRERCRRRGRRARRARERETGETTHPESTRSVVWKSPTRRPSRVDSRRRRGRARGRGRETSARAIVRARETGDEGEEEARRRTRGIVRGTSGKIDRRRTDEGTSDGR